MKMGLTKKQLESLSPDERKKYKARQSAYAKKFTAENREKINAYQRAYQKRKREEKDIIALKPRCESCTIILGSKLSGGDGVYCDRCLELNQ